MPLEVAQFINTLNPANPVGSDPLSAADDHIRMIKQALKNTFPNIDAAVTVTDNQLNELPNRVAALEAGGGGGGGGTGTGDGSPSGVSFVDELPASGAYDGEMVYLSSDETIYAWDDTASEWKPLTFNFTLADVPPAVLLVNGLPAEATDGAIVLNTVDNTLYERVNGLWVPLTITQDVANEVADASITVAKFAQGIRPIEIVDTLPTSNNVQGRLVYLTFDDKIYRYDGTQFVTGMPFGDLVGTIGADQIAANTITGGKIQAGAISANQIAAGGIIASNIAASAITTEKIAATAITAEKIATNAITTDKLAANSITAGKVSAGAIGASQIAAGAITADKIGAGEIITSSAQIGTGVIVSAKIGNAEIGTVKIAGNAVTSASVFQGSGDIGASAGSSATIVSGTVSTSGTQPILVTLSCFIGGGLSTGSLNSANADITITINLGGTVLTVVPSLTAWASNLVCATGSVLFSGVSSGSQSISATLTCNSSGVGISGVFARQPKLVVLETKR